MSPCESSHTVSTTPAFLINTCPKSSLNGSFRPRLACARPPAKHRHVDHEENPSKLIIVERNVVFDRRGGWGGGNEREISTAPKWTVLLIGPGLEYYVLRVTRFLRGPSTRAIADRLWASRTSRLLKSYAWAGRVVVSRVDVRTCAPGKRT